MAKHKADKQLTGDERKAIFLALVAAQDGKMSVAQSRKAISEQFEISERQIGQIEQEGIDANWPPLE